MGEVFGGRGERGGGGARGEGPPCVRAYVRACVRACVRAPFDLPPIYCLTSMARRAARCTPQGQEPHARAAPPPSHNPIRYQIWEGRQEKPRRSYRPKNHTCHFGLLPLWESASSPGCSYSLVPGHLTAHRGPLSGNDEQRWEQLLPAISLAGSCRASLRSKYALFLCRFASVLVLNGFTLCVLFVQLLRRLSHRIEFLGPLVAVCCAAYLSIERLGESWSHGA
jgi:hypothetical protein